MEDTCPWWNDAIGPSANLSINNIYWVSNERRYHENRGLEGSQDSDGGLGKTCLWIPEDRLLRKGSGRWGTSCLPGTSCMQPRKSAVYHWAPGGLQQPCEGSSPILSQPVSLAVKWTPMSSQEVAKLVSEWLSLPFWRSLSTTNPVGEDSQEKGPQLQLLETPPCSRPIKQM